MCMRQSNLSVTIVSCLFICRLVILSPIPAHALSRKLVLLEHDGKMYRSFWEPQGRFAGLLEEKEAAVSAIPALKLSSGFKKSPLTKLSRKFDVPLYPSLVVKPFILIEELRSELERYQRKKIKMLVDRNFHLTNSPSARSSHLPKDLRRKSGKKPFLFSPYHKRLYGLHVEFQW